MRCLSENEIAEVDGGLDGNEVGLFVGAQFVGTGIALMLGGPVVWGGLTFFAARAALSAGAYYLMQ